MFAIVKCRLTLKFLEDARDELLAMEKISLLQIKELWKEKGDVDYDEAYLEQKDLPYRWQDPLWMKMVHRFRNCERRIAQFYHQIDCNNQAHLIRRYLPQCYGNAHNSADEMVTFLAWTSNMLGAYDIKQIAKSISPYPKVHELLVEKWRKTPIDFFFGLPPNEQTKLIDRYNREEVDAWNNIKAATAVDFDYITAKEFFQKQIDDLQSMNIEDNLEASDSDTHDDEPASPLEQVYLLTENGHHHFDLLGEKESQTVKGRAFRESLGDRDWQLQQVLVVSENGPYTREELHACFKSAKVLGYPALHIAIAQHIDSLLEEAVNRGFLMKVTPVEKTI